tara:strand:+ start:130 stop:531 length:402 start_codon:yes stop_codon:yes gene_type:complete
MSVVGNSVMVYEKKYKNMYDSFTRDYKQNKETKNYTKLYGILNSLIEKNNIYISQIIKEKNSLDNYEKLTNKKEKILKDMDKEINKNNTLNLEKDTFVLLSKEKNKNIEIYYIVYILFSVILLLLEGSVVLFK